MDFKIRKIKTEPVEKNKIKALWKCFVASVGRKTALFILLAMGLSAFFGVGSILIPKLNFWEQTRSLFDLSTLEKDEKGHINLLLLGTAGDGQEGGNLSDSIMVMSINPDNPSASFLSLPRDLYIDSNIGARKINEIYAAAKYKNRRNPDKGEEIGREVIRDALSRFMEIDIHYTAVVNFQVFSDIVDALDGIDIFVPEAIQDPYYPGPNYSFQTFVVRKGLQNFDGETALKYARSRKTTSDYSRAARQQDLILAIKEKAAKLDLLSDTDKITHFYNLFKKNISTDLGLLEMLELSKIAIGIDYTNAISAVLNDDPLRKGGFLYTPAKEFFNGQFVLQPHNIDDTRLFMNLVLIQPEVLLENAQIEILNGSNISGKAGETAQRLRRLGFHIINVGNYESDTPVAKTFAQDLTNGQKSKTEAFIQQLFRIGTVGKKIKQNPQNLTDIEVILGAY